MEQEEKENQRAPDMNWLDRAIAYVDPKLAYVRLAWRDAIRGAYKAGNISRNSESWIPVNGKAEQVNQAQRDMIRGRGREAERNNDLIGSMVGILERNIVGTGFRVQADTGDEDLNEKMEKVFKKWQKKRNCDVTAAQALWEIEKMCIRRTIVDGGILFIKTFSGNPRFPFQLQSREVDDLDSNGIIRNGENLVVNGIEVDKNQKPVAYYFKEVSPDGWTTGRSVRVPAERVIPLWRKTMPSQIREISQLASSLTRANDAEEYLDTISIKEKILASLSVFLKKAIPSTGTPGRGSIAASAKSDDYDQETGYKRKRISPGMIMELQPGDEVDSVVPTGQANNARELTTMFQRMMGAGQGLSYEASSRDMSQVNYSSARQGLLEDQKTYKDWQQWLIEHFLSEVYTEVIISAVLSGELNIPDFWKKKEDYLEHSWTTPGWSWIDPVKETKANDMAIESGQDNLANVCARSGMDWREVLEQRAKELAYKKQLEERYGISMEEGSTSAANGKQKTTAAKNAKTG